MRFAYIDSNGNEIPIPSVDALALRIELGAIDEDTELYDAQADQWGPAHTHEIYHTLSRAADEGGQGFVAPLPPVAPPPTVAAIDPETEEPQIVESEELTLADAVEEEVVEEPPPAEILDLDLDLASAVSEALPSDEGDELSVAEPVAEAPGPVENSSFDFGDMGGGLELEQEFAAPEAAADEPAMDFSVEANAGGDFGGGDEPAMDFSGEGGSDAGGDALDLEKPMSEFSPEAPPAWMDAHDEDSGDADAMDFSDVADTEEVGGDSSPRGRRIGRTKPSAPKHRRQRSLVAPIVGVVVLLAIGMGGYMAWPILSARLAERGGSAESAVVMPAIPPELVAQMRSVAGVAFASGFRDARAAAGGGVASPTTDWLGGVYLASAGGFGDVETFWLGVDDVLGAVRGIDLPTFHADYERGMGLEGVSAQDRALLLERADSGFVAATRAREETYALVDELIDAALALHAFLVANEQNIQHAPASAGTSNPVLEANPSTPEIGEAMEDGIDRVTDALDALDYLDIVTADGLWAAVLTRIQDVGIR